MIEIDGRTLLTTLEEKVDPCHAVVIVIDMQKDFTTEGCFWDGIGQDLTGSQELADRLIAFLDRARAHGVPIVHVMANYDSEFMSDPMYERLYRLGSPLYCQSNTRGIEFHDGLEPWPGESVVVKHRFDAFYDTELDIILRARGIKTVILTGLVINGCVDSTARHAYFNGYYVVLGEDLAGGARPDAHQAELDIINLAFGVSARAEDIVKAWEKPADLAAERRLVALPAR
jgi:nicotinamidase-related amidase